MTTSEFFRRFLAILFVVLLCMGIWAARSILLFGFASAVIAVGLGIPVSKLQRRGWRRGWAVLVTILGFLLALAFVLLLVLPRILSGFVELLSNIPQAISYLLNLYAEVREQNPFLNRVLPPSQITSSTGLIDPLRARELLRQLANASLAIAPRLLGGVNTVAVVIVNLVFVLFIAIFFLIDPKSYVKASLYLLPVRFHERAIEIWNELHHTIKQWLSTIFLSISITMALVWLILGVLLGMPNAIVVAVFAGFATFIPNIGSILPLIPIAIFSLASDPSRLLLYAIIYLLIQFGESNIITPSIVKAELEIPAGGLMLFQLLATLALGAVGLLLAVPLLAVLIVLVREIYSFGVLGLRDVPIEVENSRAGQLTLDEPMADITAEEVVEAEKKMIKPLPRLK